MNFNRQSRAPLWESLRDHVSEGYQPFHVPGHKGGRGSWPPFAEFLGSGVFRLDLTELPGLDDLHLPQGPILEAQELAAECFGAGRTFFLVNGATVGIHAALLACTGPGDPVLVPRHAHRSVWAAMVLAGSKPVYLRPEWDRDWGIALGVTAEELERKLVDAPAIKAMLLLHPTYEGIVPDTVMLIEIAHRAGLTVVSDESHGVHFTFHPRLPVASLAAGADLVVQSTHKVLGAFTQAAMLHTCPGVTGKEVGTALNLLQSTSPSYLLMASLDAARCHMAQHGRALLDRLLPLSQEARDRINSVPGMRCLGEEILGRPGVAGYDPTRLVVSAQALGLTGYRLAEILRVQYRVQVEMAGAKYIVLLLTVADTKESIQALLRALEGVSRRAVHENSLEGSRNLEVVPGDLPLPEVVLSPREAFFAKVRKLPLRETCGEVAAEMFVPYPPGIPLICPGERITREVIDLINEYKSLGTGWQGPADPTLEMMDVIDDVREVNG